VIQTLILLIINATQAFAQTETFELKIHDAEIRALQYSNRLKSNAFDHEAAQEQANAQYTYLLPKLALQASYQYYANIPEISIFAGPTIGFGTNSTYFFGPTLSYTLWDTFSTRKTYQAASLLVQARAEDLKNAKLQLLLSVRSSYLQVQLGLVELGLIQDSLKLAQAQNRDVATRFRAGAAARLDVVISQRSVLNYEIQFKERQAQLSASLKDLLSLLGDTQIQEISHPGPPHTPNVSLILKLDSFEKLISTQKQVEISAPDDQQPQILSQTLQAESLELNAASQSAKRYPALQVFAGVSYNRPNIPNPISYWQETVGVSLSMPLFLGDPIPALAAQQRNQAQSTFYRQAQTRVDLQRDFLKSKELLQSYREQRELASQDVLQSTEAANLYYISYKSGKINYTDVQDANLQALQSKVNLSRIDAQILNQLILLKSISGKDLPHE
jgi:outer membrane protein TolC